MTEKSPIVRSVRRAAHRQRRCVAALLACSLALLSIGTGCAGHAPAADSETGTKSGLTEHAFECPDADAHDVGIAVGHGVARAYAGAVVPAPRAERLGLSAAPERPPSRSPGITMLCVRLT